MAEGDAGGETDTGGQHETIREFLIGLEGGRASGCRRGTGFRPLKGTAFRPSISSAKLTWL